MTLPDLLAASLLIAKGVLAVVSICFLISGCDDGFIDLYHLYHAVRTWLGRLPATGPDARPINVARLCEKPEQPIAVMIPAWDESAVIRRMLLTNLERIKYDQLHLFVGTYPNDPATEREVELVRERYPNVHGVVCSHDGPTNKADCLNSLYQGILIFEKEHDVRFEIFALNDSEDVIHPLCFKLFNYLVPRLDMVQLPVIPLEMSWWQFTGGHYLDEFAENHGKDMVVRASLSGTIPTAGVGCAFSRRALDVAAKANDNHLFSLESVAEDYDLGLRLGAHGLKQAFVRVPVPHEHERRFRGAREYIGIGEYFPSSLRAAVRQKARWIVGISFQGWRRLGWRGSWATKYALFRDRKGLITNPTVALAYGVVVTMVTIWTLQWWDPEFYRFPAIVERGSWLWYVILVNTFFLCLRLVQRCRFVRQVHGWRQALLSVPRQVWGNLVNVAAVSRAFYVYGRSRVTGRAVAWDKTHHRFPSEITLQSVRRRLGELLLEKRLVTLEQLELALERQRARRRPLGVVLQELGFVAQHDLAEVLAQQGHARARGRAVATHAGRASGLSTTAVFFFMALAFTALPSSKVGAAPMPSDPPAHRDTTGLADEFRRFRVYPHLDRAYRLIKEQKLTEAARELDICLGLEPREFEVWATYLDVLYRLKEYDRLVTRFEDAGELRDDGRLRRYHARAELERNHLEAVVADLRVLVNVKNGGPAGVDADHGIASSELQGIAGRFIELARADKRPDALVALLATVPDRALSPAIVYEAASALRDLGWASDARGLLTRAHGLRPRDVTVIRSLGDLAAARKDWAETIRWYGEWVNLKQAAPSHDRDQVAIVLGRAYLQLAQPLQAADAFHLAARARLEEVGKAVRKEASREGSKDGNQAAEALEAAAQALQQAGRPLQALDDLKAALQLAPSGTRNARTGLLLADLERPQDALSYLERAAELGVSEDLVPTLFGQLGYTYARLNQPQAAREAFLKALPHAAHPSAIQSALGHACFALGDAASAIEHFEQSLALEDDSHVARSLVLAYARAGRDDRAIQVIARLRQTPEGDSLMDAEVWTHLADAAFRGGRFGEASTLFRQAATRASQADGTSWTALTRAAESLERADAPAEAAHLWDELTIAEGAPHEIRATAAERAAYVHLRLTEPDRAEASFRHAIQLGHDDWRLRLDRALTLMKIERWGDAVEEATASLDHHNSARGHMVVAACLEKLNKPGLAVYHLTQSLEAAEDNEQLDAADQQLNAADRKYVLDELTALYANEANYEVASQAARRSLAISPDPAIALRLAQMERRLGRNEAARAALDAIDLGSSPASLPTALRLTVLDEQTAVNFALGDMPRAMKALREAAALEPSQSRLFQLGMSSRESGDLAQAIKYLSASLEKAPGNVRYREALGYTYLQAGQLTNAAAMLTTVARQEPGNVQVQQDLANVLVHLGDRPGAIRQLRQTIQVAASTDARAEATSETGSETGSMDQRERAMLQMRSTVAQLGKTYEVAGYFGYQTLAAPNGVIDRTAPSLLLSQGGFELARYLTGSRRGLSLIGRIMSVGSVAEGQAGTAGLQGALSQAAVGLRYKPFVTENLNVSFERLFQLGGGLPNSWLARALYGKETGADLKPDRRAQAYGLIYGDLAGFIGPSRSLLAYGETRLGVSVGLGNSWIVRPHVIALGRHDLLGSAPDAIQAGAGVGLAHYFRDPGFVGPAPSLELRVYGTAAGSRALSTDGLTGIRGLTLVTTLRF